MLPILFTSLVSFTAVAYGSVWRAGVNIAGFDFGCDTSGNCPLSSVTPPIQSVNGNDGVGQMQHFVSIGLNTFRLPVSWQYLVNDNLGGNLDETNFNLYDELMQACIKLGAMCILDIHNYARWNGQIVGQSNGAVTDAHLTSLWEQLATHYANDSQVIFGVMNEPHDLPDINTWGTTVAGVVKTIRTAVGSNSQIILLPGTDYTSVGSFISTGSTTALQSIKNNDGTTDNLIFDVHQYLDNAGGTIAECYTDGTANINSLATWLRSNNRQAFLTETGGGSTDSCHTAVCAELTSLNNNGDVYLGWIGWAAGSFQPYPSYPLGVTPTVSNGVYTDATIMTECIMGMFAKSSS